MSPGSNWSTSTTSSPRPASVQAKRRPESPRSDDHNPHATNIKGQTLYLRDVFVAAALASLVIGHSVEGREIRATRVGPETARVNVLVVGDVHGNEPAGEAIVARLRRAKPPDGVALWLVRTGNPDGRAAHTRHNARGVDLNRNFPWRWRPAARGVYFPGPRAGSEPETQALMRLVRRVRPQLGIYYHQLIGMTVRARGADPKVRPTTRAGPVCRCARCRTTAARRSAGRTG